MDSGEVVFSLEIYKHVLPLSHYPGQLQCQSPARDWGPVAGVGGRVGKSGKSGVSHGKGEGHVVHAGVNCVCNVCVSSLITATILYVSWYMSFLQRCPLFRVSFIRGSTVRTCMSTWTSSR